MSLAPWAKVLRWKGPNGTHLGRSKGGVAEKQRGEGGRSAGGLMLERSGQFQSACEGQATSTCWSRSAIRP